MQAFRSSSLKHPHKDGFIGIVFIMSGYNKIGMNGCRSFFKYAVAQEPSSVFDAPFPLCSAAGYRA